MRTGILQSPGTEHTSVRVATVPHNGNCDDIRRHVDTYQTDQGDAIVVRSRLSLVVVSFLTTSSEQRQSLLISNTIRTFENSLFVDLFSAQLRTTMRFFAATVVYLTLLTSCDAFAPAAFRPHSVKTTVSFSLTELNAQGSKITMPALSSTMKEGRVVSWLKSEGDEIEAGEAIMVVESDKADMDVEAFEDGFLAKIIVAEGEMAPVGEAVALVAETMDEIDAVIAMFSGDAAAPAAEEAPAAATAGRFTLGIVGGRVIGRFVFGYLDVSSLVVLPSCLVLSFDFLLYS
jgi:biotin carboxyl carrier protein